MNTAPLSYPVSYDTITEAESLHEAICARARVLWEERGCPSMQDEAIWLEAEREFVPLPGSTRVIFAGSSREGRRGV